MYFQSKRELADDIPTPFVFANVNHFGTFGPETSSSRLFLLFLLRFIQQLSKEIRAHILIEDPNSPPWRWRSSFQSGASYKHCQSKQKYELHTIFVLYWTHFECFAAQFMPCQMKPNVFKGGVWTVCARSRSYVLKFSRRALTSGGWVDLLASLLDRSICPRTGFWILFSSGFKLLASTSWARDPDVKLITRNKLESTRSDSKDNMSKDINSRTMRHQERSLFELRGWTHEFVGDHFLNGSLPSSSQTTSCQSIPIEYSCSRGKTTRLELLTGGLSNIYSWLFTLPIHSSMASSHPSPEKRPNLRSLIERTEVKPYDHPESGCSGRL